MARRTKEQAEETRQQIIAAARKVFHRRGVQGSSLEMVAREAGLTRGAIYWHFEDKAELVLAVRQSVLLSIRSEIESIFDSDRYLDPLDAIGAALQRFFQILERCPEARLVLETIICGCERAAGPADVHSDIEWPTTDFPARLEYAYCQAAALGTLRPGLSPRAIARDTSIFFAGLVDRFLSSEPNGQFGSQVSELVACHMTLRRAA